MVAWREGTGLPSATASASIIGTGLTAINQGDTLITATLTPVLLWEGPLTDAVPFGVSMYSASVIGHDQTASQQDDAAPLGG